MRPSPGGQTGAGGGWCFGWPRVRSCKSVCEESERGGSQPQVGAAQGPSARVGGIVPCSPCLPFNRRVLRSEGMKAPTLACLAGRDRRGIRGRLGPATRWPGRFRRSSGRGALRRARGSRRDTSVRARPEVTRERRRGRFKCGVCAGALARNRSWLAQDDQLPLMGLPAVELQRLGSSHQLGFHAQSSLIRFLFRFAERFVGLERAQQPCRHKR